MHRLISTVTFNFSCDISKIDEMLMMIYNVIYLMIPLFEGSSGIEHISNCNRKFHATCHGEQILIYWLNTTDSLAREIVKCNGREECTIENPGEICYELIYWCRRSKYDKKQCTFVCKSNVSRV